MKNYSKSLLIAGLILVVLILGLVFTANLTKEASVVACGDPINYEGQEYATVEIGTQCWFAENINVGTRIDADWYSYQGKDCDDIKKYCYDNDENNCDKYGGLYEWNMAVCGVDEGQGICPDGWRVPTDEDWKILEGTVDSTYGVGDAEWDGISNRRGYDIGTKLKAKKPDWDGTDDYGFSALPGGWYYGFGFVDYFNFAGSWWSSSEDDSNEWYDDGLVWYRSMVSDDSEVFRISIPKNLSFSVRCLRD